MNTDLLSVRFINVGYGEAILLETQREGEAFTVLIDGGSAEAEEFVDRSSGRIPLHEYLAKRGIGKIDLLICTHLHEDHISGLLPVVEQCEIEAFRQGFAADFYQHMRPLDPMLYDHPSRQKFVRCLNDYIHVCALLDERGVPIHMSLAGDQVEFAPGFSMEVLAPSPARQQLLEERVISLYQSLVPPTLKQVTAIDAGMNNFSLLLRVDFGENVLLLPGDLNMNGYPVFVLDRLKANLFKLGHHGQADSLKQMLLDLIDPESVVCCASSDKRYNSANKALLSMVRASGANLYYSDTPPVGQDLQQAPPHEALCFTFSKEALVEVTYEI